MLETQSGRFSLQWVARRLFPERSSWQREILDILPGRITVSVCVYVLFSVAYRAWLEGCEPPPVTSACVSFLFFFFFFVHRGLFSPNSQMNRKRMSLTGVYFFFFIAVLELKSRLWSRTRELSTTDSGRLRRVLAITMAWCERGVKRDGSRHLCGTVSKRKMLYMTEKHPSSILANLLPAFSELCASWRKLFYRLRL